jgi:hypothetical protein
VCKDLSLEQAMNVATLPGIVGPSSAWCKSAPKHVTSEML